jgi:hypothetical protein
MGFLLGYLVKKSEKCPPKLYLFVNQFIIFFCLPSISLLKIPTLEFNGQMIHLVITAWLIFFAGIPFFYLLSKLFNWKKETLVCLIVVCGLGNTAFIGLPVIDNLFGEKALTYAVFIDQPGSFLIISTVGTALCIITASGKISIAQILFKLITFPPFIAFLFAVFVPIHPSGLLKEIMLFLIKIIGPLALFSLGLQFSLNFKEMEWIPLTFGLFYRLLLGPFIVLIYLKVFYGKSDLINTVGIIENAMAPMMTAAIISAKYNLNPKLGNALVTLGVPISILTILLWKLILV